MRKRAWSIAIVGLVMAAACGQSVTQTASRTSDITPSLSAADLALFQIHNAVDVSTMPPQDLPVTAVSRDAAIGLAQREVPKLPEIAILHASAPADLAKPDRSVWVVLFAGGDIPFDGPVGAPTPAATARIMGVIIDDTTGEFISGFSR